MSDMKYTALHDLHIKAGAKMSEFAGYHMPLWYSRITEEHMAVRKAVGIFDVSHMGDLIIEGPDAAEFLSFALPTDVLKKKIMQASYSAFVNHRGVMIDDTIATKLDDYKFLVVPNAATADIIYHWLYSLSAGYKVEVKNVSSKFSSIAVQGPMAEETLQKMVDVDISKEKVPFFHATMGNIDGVKIENNELSEDLLYISRTGYTGEDGFELIFPNSNAVDIWNKLIEEGKEHGLKPCGLASRDSLRLEKGLLLSGQDFDPHHEPRTPVESGTSWIVNWEHEFIGRERIENLKKEKKYELFRGIILKGRGIPRHGDKLYVGDEQVGYLTSGTLSPVLNTGIGLGYVKRPYIKVGTEVDVEIRGKRIRAEVRKPRLV